MLTAREYLDMSSDALDGTKLVLLILNQLVHWSY